MLKTNYTNLFAIMNKTLYLFLVLVLATSTLALPSTTLSVVYPLADQRPPVARVGTPFSWSILPGTFSNSNGNAGVTYSVSNLPSWASFSSEMLTIRGTPDASRLGSVDVVITAHDSSHSSSVSESFEMLIVQGPPPRVKLPLATQLGSGAVLGSAKYDHATNGITVPPNWSWSIGLLPDTFVTDSGAGIYYTAYEAGTTSLPSWIKFNTITATFDGVSPNEQKDVTIVVYGSDHAGFGDVLQNFTLTVTQHSLDLVQPLPPINASVQSVINYTIPFSSFTIDGSPLNLTTAIQETVDLSATPYLSHDSVQHSISGTLPESLLAQNNVTIPVVFTNPNCHNNVTTQVVLRVLPGLFTSSVLPELRVRRGQAFSLDLKQYTSNLNATYSLAQISPSEAQAWIHFTTYPLTLSGTPPDSYETTGSPIKITLEANGLNGARSKAEFPLRFEEESSASTSSPWSHGLSDSSKLTIAIVFGAVGGIMLLILIMRTCRKYCSADGMREREDEVYHSHYAYAKEKSFVGKQNSEKQTPMSLGDTFVAINSPKWKEDVETGGPMMLVTHNELAMNDDAQPPPKALKHFDLFKFFSRNSRSEAQSSTSHASLRGLGIIARDHRVINVLTSAQVGQAGGQAFEENDDADDYDSEDITSVNQKGRHPDASTDDQRSSWNTSGSSSLFYSDTQGEESETASSKSSGPDGKWLVKPSASVPRRRQDFKPTASPTLKPERQSDGVDVGTIRMVIDRGGGLSSDTNTSEDDGLALSESLGAIKTASYRKISPESLYSGPITVTGSEADSGSSLRPRLIAFNSQRVPNHKKMPFDRRISSSIIHDMVEDAHEGDHVENLTQTPPRHESDIAGSHRLSAQSIYTPPDPLDGSPATSAIFFSPSRDQHWNPSAPAIPSPLSASFSAPRIETPSPNPNCKTISDLPSTSGSSYLRSPSPHFYRPEAHREYRGRNAPIVVNVGVGEPFHMTPSLNPPPSGRTSGSPEEELVPLAEGNVRYFALTHFPGDPEKDRKQLPEWLHFDARAYEVWGIPGNDDIGLIPIQIIARKTVTLPGPSARQAGKQAGTISGTHQQEIEEVVSRLVLDVVDRRATMGGSGHGDVTVVTF